MFHVEHYSFFGGAFSDLRRFWNAADYSSAIWVLEIPNFARLLANGIHFILRVLSGSGHASSFEGLFRPMIFEKTSIGANLIKLHFLLNIECRRLWT